MANPLPTAAIGGPEERATFSAVSLVPSGTQEQVPKLENLLKVGLGKGGNGIPGVKMFPKLSLCTLLID